MSEVGLTTRWGGWSRRRSGRLGRRRGRRFRFSRGQLWRGQVVACPARHGFLVSLPHLGVGSGQIGLRRVQRGMPEQFCQRDHRQLVFDQLPGEGVTQLMAGHRHTGLGGVVSQPFLKAIDRHRLSLSVGAQRGVRRGGTLGQPALHDGVGIRRERDDALLATLADHAQAGGNIGRRPAQHIAPAQGNDFTDAQRGDAIAKCELLAEMNGARIEYAALGRDTSTVEGYVQHSAEQMVSGIERINIARRMKSGRRNRAREGRVIATTLHVYGYAIESKRDDLGRKLSCVMVVNEEQARVVRLIFEWYVIDNLSPYAIAERLTGMKIPTPRGRNTYWRNSTVRDILKNETYTGTWHYGKNHVTYHDTPDGCVSITSCATVRSGYRSMCPLLSRVNCLTKRRSGGNNGARRATSRRSINTCCAGGSSARAVTVRCVAHLTDAGQPTIAVGTPPRNLRLTNALPG